MSKCLKGKRNAQKQLYEKYKVQAFSVCLRYANSKFEAEDFLQEGFIKLFKQLHKYDSTIAPLGAWMKTMFVRVCLDQIRKKRRQPYVKELTDYERELSTNFSVVDELNRKDLLELIQLLPEGYRNVFNLFVIDGYKHKEIAELLNISENTSKSQLFRAKKQLQLSILDQKEKLKEYGE